MTPKEKAKELELKFSCYAYFDTRDEDNNACLKAMKFNAKQCALIAVDELINNTWVVRKKDYWRNVKNEIEKL